MRWRWQSIQAAKPAATAEAEQLQSQMQQQAQQQQQVQHQEVEDGEMPPLPTDEATAVAAPPPSAGDQAEDDTQPALPVEDDITSDRLGEDVTATAAAVDLASENLNDSPEFAEAPPLPTDDPIPDHPIPDDPSSVVNGKSADQAAATELPSTADSARAVAGVITAAAVEPDAAVAEDVDMEVDLDADSRASTASRPASAGTATTEATPGTSAGLPNWAGYYMAHGYTYPYYGKCAASEDRASRFDAGWCRRFFAFCTCSCSSMHTVHSNV